MRGFPVRLTWVCYEGPGRGLVYDWRTRGRPHPVYLVALPILMFLAWAVIPVSETAAWHGFARNYLQLAGK